MKKQEIIKENKEEHSNLPLIVALSIIGILVASYFFFSRIQTCG